MRKFNQAAWVENIILTYQKGLDLGEALGSCLAWYEVAHRTCLDMAQRLGYELWQVTGVVAALSPRNRWERNLYDAEVVLKAIKAGIGPGEVRVCTFGSNKAKAFLAAMAHHPIEVEGILSGQKLVAFYHLLTDPTAPDVVVDGHAYAIAEGIRLVLDKSPTLTARHFRELAQAYREAGNQVGLSGSKMQAVTWCIYRHLHRIESI